jgi:hypothetical protein
MFDEPNLVSAAGLVPIMELAEQTGLSWLIGKQVDLPSTRVKSGAVNPVGKLTTIIGGMICGADSIDDVDVLRAGGTPRVFDEVYAPSTLGIFLREFTFGHANQLAAVAREHLAALAARTALLPGIEQRAFLDIDSLVRPVYGHLKQGASFGHAKIASRALLRLGLSPQQAHQHAIGGIDEASYTSVHYPGAVEDPDTGELISNAEVAETRYTLRLGRVRTLTVRLVGRRVKDARYPDALFPVWRYHPFVTNSTLPTAEADITHRRHAIVETTFADLIDEPLAHIPSVIWSC